MASGDLTYLRAQARLELADTGALWSDGQLDRASVAVTGDISRLMPREQVYETTFRLDVDNEAFTSAAVGTAKALANKPIKPKSETVTSSPAGTTYTRDTDYSMDYINGTITVLSGGAMLGSTAYLISYDRDPIALDISSLTTLLAPIRVEVERDQPQEFRSFFRWGDLLYLGAAQGRSQERLADKDHVQVYYHGTHTAPAVSTSPTYPRFLDEVAVRGVVAYALFIKSRQRSLQAVTDMASARTTIGNIAAIHTNVNTFSASLTTELGTANTALDDADLATNGPLDKAETFLGLIDAALLDKIGTALTAAIAKLTGATDSVKEALDLSETVWTDEVKHILTASGIPNAEDFLETGDDFINKANLGNEVAQLYAQYAGQALSMATLWDAKRKDYFREAEGWLGGAQAFISEAAQRAADAQVRVNDVQAWLTDAQVRVALGRAYTDNASQYAVGMAHRLGQIQAYLNEAAHYFQAATAEVTAADRFLADARERHAEYWRALTDRVQQARRRSMSSLRQYADADTAIIRTVPTGSES